MCFIVSPAPPYSWLLPFHIRTGTIAALWFSMSHYFSLPINSAHRCQVSLKTFRGYIGLARLNPIYIFWHFKIVHILIRLAFIFYLWHLDMNCLLGISISESWLTWDSPIFCPLLCPLPAITHWKFQNCSGTTFPKKPFSDHFRHTYAYLILFSPPSI